MKYHHFLMIAVAALLAACTSISPLIQASSIQDSVGIVAQRHDSYVQDDDSLSDEERQEDLEQSSELMVLVFSRDQIGKEELASKFDPVANRHDIYVVGDAALSELQRRVYLRSTQELRRLTEDLD